MHLQVMVRGVNPQVELWKIMAQGQFFKVTRKNMDSGEDEDILFQMHLRPSVLGTWELCFPEKSLATVLSLLGGGADYGDVSFRAARMGVLRACCGVKKIPKKIIEESKTIPSSIAMQASERGLSNLEIPGVAVHIIGYRKDRYGEITDPNTGITYSQELI